MCEQITIVMALNNASGDTLSCAMDRQQSIYADS